MSKEGRTVSFPWCPASLESGHSSLWRKTLEPTTAVDRKTPGSPFSERPDFPSVDALSTGNRAGDHDLTPADKGLLLDNF